MKNTLLKLEYRDASNYKQSMDFVLNGKITQAQIIIIASKLNDGESIIAEQVGLPTISEQFSENFDFPTEDDHVWTDIEQFSCSHTGIPTVEEMLTDKEPTSPMTVADFVKKISEVEWDEMKEVERLEIPL